MIKKKIYYSYIDFTTNMNYNDRSSECVFNFRRHVSCESLNWLWLMVQHFEVEFDLGCLKNLDFLVEYFVVRVTKLTGQQTSKVAINSD